MGDDTEYIKLPLVQRCTHKLWKARLHGYTEAAKLFEDEEDEKAAIFGQFTGLVAKFVADSHAAAQEKGLEVTLHFVKNSNLAGKTVKDVMPAIVSKCVAANKKGTQELAVQVTLMYIEQEKQEAVIEELIKGLEAKNPKIVAACIVAITTSLREFGAKVISVKPIVKPLINLLEDRDKTVRDESKALTVEIYRWIGDAIKPQLSKLKPIQLTELETEFKKVAGERAVPNRYLRSQQAKKPKAFPGGEAQSDDLDGGVEAPPEEQIDPLSLVEPLNILSKIPNDFYEKLEAKKWQERKEALEALDKIMEYPKFEKGDYADLVRALLKVINKDSNVVVVGLATKCVARLVQVLKKMFQPYAHSTLSQLLPKFKEKKMNVVTPLREAVDGIFTMSNLEAIQEDVIASLGDKNPSIKAETAAFLARSFAQCSAAVLNKKVLKPYVTALLKTLNESDPTVRDNSAEALGVIQKVVGEKVLTPFLGDIDALKLAKIKECSEKAVVKAVPAPAAAKPVPPKVEAPKKVLSGGAIAKQAPKVQKPSPPPEREVPMEVVEEKAVELLPENVRQNMGDVDWNKRLEAMEVFQNILMSLEPFESAGEIMIKILISTKPGLKDNNFQVSKLKLECLKHIAENLPIGPGVVTALVPDVVAKFSDVNHLLAGETLMAMAEATNLDLVGNLVLEYAFSQKSVKIQQVAFDWMAEAVQNFGLIISIDSLMGHLKKGLGSTNLAVRTAVAALAGVVSVYMGADALLGLLQDEKPSVLNMVRAEIEKRSEEEPLEPSLKCKINSPPINIPTAAPSQPVKQIVREASNLDDDDQPRSAKPVARVDISLKITEQLLAELGGKNWKDRNEALVTLQSMVSEAKSIKSNLGELPPILCQRFTDSNGKIIVTALELCGNLATAMGPAGAKNQLRNFAKGIFTGLGDNKAVVRTAAMSCLNAWVNEAGVKEFFQSDVIYDSIKTGSTFLRIELWTWLGDMLPTVRGLPKDNLTILIPLLFAALEDRAVDVRKAGNHAVLGMMTHLGYQAMAKEVEKLKPASKPGVLAILDKIRPDVVEIAPSPMVKGKPDGKLKTTITKQLPPKIKAPLGKVEPAKSRKKEEDLDTSPLFGVNKLKNQRILDEQKLKIIKWSFSSPRAEFVELLRDQMTTAGFNKTLIANMFHADFKFHLKAIESLIGDLDNVDGLVANLDLIMKWMTLRFFDTNPSVLLKGLEYLQSAIAILIDMGYQMYDVEANAFIPHLVLKIGDPKDAVRDRVHAIIKQFADLYSPGKLFALIMEGLKSKNSRQRTECLDELGYLIETRGTTVCLPSPAAALKEISKQIADRDNSVRSAALNAIVAAYFVDGEKIYKMIGQLSDKDMSYLEERIKRASQKRSQMPPPKKPEPKREEEPVYYDEPEEQEQRSPEREEVVEEEPEPTPEPVRRRFRMPDSPLVSGPKIQIPEVPKLKEIDCTFLDEPLYIPEHLRAKLNIKPPANPVIESMIRDVASLNLEVAIEGGRKLDATLESEVSEKLAPYAKGILDSLCAQLKAVNTYSTASHGKSLGSLYRLLLRIISHIFKSKTGISKAAEDNHLKILMQQLLIALVHEKTKEFQEGGYNKWLAVFIHNIIENSDLTNATVAAVSMQYDIVANPPSNTAFYEPTSRCLVKAITVIRRAESIDEALNLERVLYACYQFMQSYPRHTWRTRPSDLPLKAVKTLLLNLVTIKGADIFNSIRNFENVYTSELAEYLKKLVNQSTGSTKMTQEMCNHLSQVFDKIASEATAKQGMMLLYEFKKQYPQIDLSPVLRPTSTAFQEYIASGLKELEKERGPLPQPLSALKNANSNQDEIPTEPSEQPMYFLKILRRHQEKLGFPLTSLDILQKNENRE